MNLWAITGHLGADPKLNHTQGGDAVINLRVAVPNRVKKGSEWLDEPIWTNVTVFGKRAEGLHKILRKGRLIEASGELRLRTYETRGGEQRTEVELLASRCEPLGKGDGEGAGAGRSGAQQRDSGGSGQPAHDYANSTSYDESDDIPF